MDEDDPTRNDYPGTVIVGTPTGDPTGPLNAAALASDSDIVGFIGDDSRPETSGWDARILAAHHRPAFSWTDDGHDKPWPSTVFVSSSIVRALGWLALPTLRRGYFDAVWVWLGNETRTAHEFPDIMIRHINPPDAPGAATADVIERDRVAFGEWFTTRKDADADIVRRLYIASYF